ncbi:hypothetical protein NBRC3257_0800 [Gluconobacter thailandicus NBRC 3257]|uniref:Transposase n=1 Tax=Gluconobacter thailandicus NBRC 3257 TaxID=1381097 RepID=A0ABQ0IUD5_GLUTH|nr:hypothetical protein [Gluconobacter thailandicus]AFW00258.1 hypothetical protein B932_0653 [Gluconobacter oxydans H24]GAC88032.1 hypothetical protein NBRC3255_1693 [Gluconobacter thailandicus NBRC 3255]GAD25801.1 hypothetical protein NBRC3257_0800 [Gluconobacter thailandicus NBRC 3257]
MTPRSDITSGKTVPALSRLPGQSAAVASSQQWFSLTETQDNDSKDRH